MKRGFTLIELLAVIVILAIIAIIATPTIIGIVEKVKKGSADASALNYIDAIEKQQAINLMDSDSSNDINEGVYTLPFSDFEVKVKGQAPNSGWVEITKSGVSQFSLIVGEYVVSYDGESKTVEKGSVVNNIPNQNIVYRYSSDLLHYGDIIDIESGKYTQYKNSSGNTLTNPVTNNFTGTYSKSIDDVISNTIFLKEYLDKDNKIINSEVCIHTDITICVEKLNVELIDDDMHYFDYEEGSKRVIDAFKWNTDTNTSLYSDTSCTIYSALTRCSHNNAQISIDSYSFLSAEYASKGCFYEGEEGIESGYTKCS